MPATGSNIAIEHHFFTILLTFFLVILCVWGKLRTMLAILLISFKLRGSNEILISVQACVELFSEKEIVSEASFFSVRFSSGFRFVFLL